MDCYEVSIDLGCKNIFTVYKKHLTKKQIDESDPPVFDVNVEMEGYAQKRIWTYVEANDKKEALIKAKEKFIQHYQSFIEDIKSASY